MEEIRHDIRLNALTSTLSQLQFITGFTDQILVCFHKAYFIIYLDIV